MDAKVTDKLNSQATEFAEMDVFLCPGLQWLQRLH